MSRTIRSLLLIAACALPLAFTAACDVDEGPGEEAGEALDEATEDMDDTTVD